MDQATIHSAADASLFSLVRSAATAVSGPKHETVGRLSVTEIGAEQQPKLSLDATASAHGLGWKIEQLDISWRSPSATPLSPNLVQALLEQFGSRKYTNLTLADTAGEIADLTLSFSSRFAYWGQLITLVRPALSLDERATLGSLLRALGFTDKAPGVARRKPVLRAPPTVAAQTQAFVEMARAGFGVELYTSALPATHAVRIAQDWLAGTAPKLSLSISYGLTGNSPPSSDDERRTQQFLSQHFAVQLANKSWQVTNAHGAEDDYRPHGAIPHSKRRGWSLNWGQR
jgi:hypothetical protein